MKTFSLYDNGTWKINAINKDNKRMIQVIQKERNGEGATWQFTPDTIVAALTPFPKYVRKILSSIINPKRKTQFVTFEDCIKSGII